MNRRRHVPRGVPFLFIRNSAGKPDGMWTLTVASFAACLLLLAVGVTTHGPNATAVLPFGLSLFGGCAAAYFGRRWSEAKYGDPDADYTPQQATQEPFNARGESDGP